MVKVSRGFSVSFSSKMALITMASGALLFSLLLGIGPWDVFVIPKFGFRGSLVGRCFQLGRLLGIFSMIPLLGSEGFRV